MAHFAKIDNLRIVVAVETGSDDSEELKLCAESGDTYRKTSYNTIDGTHSLGGTPFRKNFAGIGYTYDLTRDAFIPPQPYPSWILNEDTCQYEAPVAHPDDDVDYTWDEETTNWKEVI
jgi:hypothetical protein